MRERVIENVPIIIVFYSIIYEVLFYRILGFKIGKRISSNAKLTNNQINYYIFLFWIKGESSYRYRILFTCEIYDILTRNTGTKRVG